MSNKISLIQPSHIKASCAYIERIRSQIDLVIHLVDSRSITIGENIKIESLFPNKPVLRLYTKQDLSDKSNLTNQFNLKENNCRRKIIKLIEKTLDNEYKKKKLMYRPCAQVIIVGIPNVGKSTLINLLKSSKSAKNENSPGTTKQVSKFFIGNNIWVYDTPGILLPKLNKPSDIRKLFLLNSLPINHQHNSVFLEQTFLYLKKHYPDKILSIANKIADTYDDFLIDICTRFNLKAKNNQPAIEDAEQKFLILIHSGKIGKIEWDKLWESQIIVEPN